MAEPFLSLGARERADILWTVAARSMRSAVILEKDIWVCWVLQALFSMPDPHPMGLGDEFTEPDSRFQMWTISRRE